MLVCKHCSTQNSLDSTFCKRCGTSLPEEELEIARAKLEEVVAEGEAKLAQGKIEEALAIAEAATAANPSLIAGWSLKSSIHERRGEIAEALESAEQMVELSPDSELAKIRRNQLRSALMLHAQPVATDRRLALVAAFAMVVIVISGGALIARNFARASDSGVASNGSTGRLEPLNGANPAGSNLEGGGTGAVVPGAGSVGSGAAGAGTAGASPGAGQSPAGQPAAGPDSSANGAGVANEQGSNSSGQTPVIPNVRGDGSLPPAGGSGGSTEIRPVFPNVNPREPQTGGSGVGSQDPDPSVGPSRPAPRAGGADPDPVAAKSNGGVTPPAPAGPEPDRGTYEITVHRNTTKVGGSETVGGNNSNGAGTSAGGSKAYAKIGNEQFQVGNYSGAVVSFERAIQGGGDPIALNQRLGLAYQKLGRNGDAAEAFRRSIDACDAALRSGRGDRERVQAVKDSCSAYLKVVQGG